MVRIALVGFLLTTIVLFSSAELLDDLKKIGDGIGGLFTNQKTSELHTWVKENVEDKVKPHLNNTGEFLKQTADGLIKDANNLSMGVKSAAKEFFDEHKEKLGDNETFKKLMNALGGLTTTTTDASTSEQSEGTTTVTDSLDR